MDTYLENRDTQSTEIRAAGCLSLRSLRVGAHRRLPLRIFRVDDLALSLSACIVPNNARDLQFAANSRSFASLRMTTENWELRTDG